MTGRGDWYKSAQAEHPHDTEDLVRLVRITRQERGWTQDRLAAAAGLPPLAVARFEAGETVPAEPLAMRFIEVMNES
ncbi:helix-turn-helix domain-containing protein [Actinocrispum wychmicini]|uniref:helix-turn-helix domain-containing protein n=1 Tax=Actinocrispum wychmicini TaxID=1213861 RepID=UPI0010435F0C|nr:helix-turn-helix domain-containing protein [Actinocrispum wychmicini]